MGFDPVTMFIISAGMQVAQGISQYSQQKKADKAARAAAEQQAALMEKDSEIAANAELAEAERHRRMQKMLFLKSGVTLEGSPLLVMEETRAKGEENAKNVREGGQARADLTRQQGSVKRASLTSTALSTAAGISGSYSDMQILKKQLG